MSEKEKERNLKKVKNYFEINKNYQELWETVKAMPRGKFIALNVIIRKERSKNQSSTLLP